MFVVPIKKRRTSSEWQLLAEKELSRLVKKAKPGARATVTVVGASAIKRLNAKYRKKNKPTDVLSFPAPEFFVKQGLLGELLVCLPVLKIQAAERGHSPEEELTVLLAHGLLHLLGYDHELGPKEALKMKRAEANLLGSKAGLISR